MEMGIISKFVRDNVCIFPPSAKTQPKSEGVGRKSFR